MEKISLKVENHTTNFWDIVLFGGASYVSKTPTQDGEFISIVCDPIYEEAQKLWNSKCRIEFINALCPNARKLNPNDLDIISLYKGPDKKAAYYIHTEDPNQSTATVPIEPSWITKEPTQLMSVSKKGVLAYTDEATCFCFTMAPKMIINISMTLSLLRKKN